MFKENTSAIPSATEESVIIDTSAEPVDNRLFTSDFVLAMSADFANALGMQMLIATLPLYVLSLGGGQSAAGLACPKPRLQP